MPDNLTRAINVRETLAGKHLLLTGASGFLGQVFLAMLLARLPEIGRVTLLLRPKAGKSATERFCALINGSPVFRPLRAQHGPELSTFIHQRVEILEGDTTSPGLGVPKERAERLFAGLDLVIHCAGLVDFNPDLKAALRHNVDGTLNVGNFAHKCSHAALMHISTCYVAGSRQGLVRERLTPDEAPSGQSFDPAGVYEALTGDIAQSQAELTSDEARAEIALRVARGLEKRGISPGVSSVAESLKHGYEKRWLKERNRERGSARAAASGFRNIYTFSKFLAEGLLLEAAAELPLTVVRPAIIESALSFPFPGWNQGLNASVPIVHLGGTWFRYFPSRRSLVFDVIPVDLVCNAMFTIAAALLQRRHAPVYQIGTSTRNPLLMDRVVDLTMLGHRRRLRQESDSLVERQLLSRWDPVVVEPEHPLRMENLSRAAASVEKALQRLPQSLPAPLQKYRERAAAMAKNSGYVFGQIDRLLKSFSPFIYDDHYTFESVAIARHPAREPLFTYAPEAIDWRDYWVNTHMPGLRQWVWPTIHGQEIPAEKPEFVFEMPRSEKDHDTLPPQVAARPRPAP